MAGLAGTVAYDYAVGGGRMDNVTNTAIPGSDGNPEVRAYVAKPAGTGPFPTVIMIHEFFGLNESITSRADLLAEEGYLVIAPDTFRGSTTSLIPRAIYQVISTKPENINQDLDSVFAWLEAQPEVDSQRIAILGFCYGGRASLGYSLHNDDVAATIVFYGSPETNPEILAALPGPVLGIFGVRTSPYPWRMWMPLKRDLKPQAYRIRSRSMTVNRMPLSRMPKGSSRAVRREKLGMRC